MYAASTTIICTQVVKVLEGATSDLYLLQVAWVRMIGFEYRLTDHLESTPFAMLIHWGQKLTNKSLTTANFQLSGVQIEAYAASHPDRNYSAALSHSLTRTLAVSPLASTNTQLFHS